MSVFEPQRALLVTGSRSFEPDPSTVGKDAFAALWRRRAEVQQLLIDEMRAWVRHGQSQLVINGGARGVDQWSTTYAVELQSLYPGVHFQEFHYQGHVRSSLGPQWRWWDGRNPDPLARNRYLVTYLQELALDGCEVEVLGVKDLTPAPPGKRKTDGTGYTVRLAREAGIKVTYKEVEPYAAEVPTR